MLNKSFASLYKLGDSQISMAVPNFLSSDSGLQILHSALRFRSFTPPDGCVYGDKDGCVYGDKECHSKQPLVVILSTLSLSFRAKRRICTEGRPKLQPLIWTLCAETLPD